MRIEAQPGNQVQRYMVSFTEPYLFDTPITLGLSAFYFERLYFDYNEDRVGGRMAYGYRLTPDLSISAAIRAEDVKISHPRVAGVSELDAVLGSTDFFSGRVTLAHDTRDNSFIASAGHYLELGLEQGFGEFSYPRAEIDYRQYFTMRERPDGTGKHILAFSSRVGFSGSDTPLFERYFAGGYSSLRGFSFRGASPIDSGVRVGGDFKFLNSLEYFFPLTSDDMIKGTVFCDFGTVEDQIEIKDFRVAPGVGVLFSIPALGPAPLGDQLRLPDRQQSERPGTGLQLLLRAEPVASPTLPAFSVSDQRGNDFPASHSTTNAPACPTCVEQLFITLFIRVYLQKETSRG